MKVDKVWFSARQCIFPYEEFISDKTNIRPHGIWSNGILMGTFICNDGWGHRVVITVWDEEVYSNPIYGQSLQENSKMK